MNKLTHKTVDYQKAKNILLKYAKSRLPTTEDAEDATQTAMLMFLIYQGRTGGITRPYACMVKMLKGIIHRYYQKDRNSPECYLINEETTGGWTFMPDIWMELDEKIEVISNMDEMKQEITKRIVYGNNITCTAKELGMSRSYLYAQYIRLIRKQLKDA